MRAEGHRERRALLSNDNGIRTIPMVFIDVKFFPCELHRHLVPHRAVHSLIAQLLCHFLVHRRSFREPCTYTPIRRAAVSIRRSSRLPSRENTDRVLRLPPTSSRVGRSTPSVFSSRFFSAAKGDFDRTYHASSPRYGQ